MIRKISAFNSNSIETQTRITGALQAAQSSLTMVTTGTKYVKFNHAIDHKLSEKTVNLEVCKLFFQKSC